MEDEHPFVPSVGDVDVVVLVRTHSPRAAQLVIWRGRSSRCQWWIQNWQSKGNAFSSLTNIYYRPQGKVMFAEASASHSVHKGREVCLQGVCLWGSAFRDGVEQTPPGLPQGGWGLPRGDLHPHRVCIGGGSVRQTRIVTSSGSHCSSQYASYWNAFLFPMFIAIFLLLFYCG